MKKHVKFLAACLVVCFLSATAFGADTQIRTKVTITPESPIFYENYIGIETPTRSQDIKLRVEAKYNEIIVSNFDIKNANGFTVINAETEYENNVAVRKAFKLKAPDTTGTRTIAFEGRTADGKLFTFNTKVTVVEDDPGQNWMRAGLIAGIVLVATVVVVILSNSGK
jgi:hypothetical protein